MIANCACSIEFLWLTGQIPNETFSTPKQICFNWSVGVHYNSAAAWSNPYGVKCACFRLYKFHLFGSHLIFALYIPLLISCFIGAQQRHSMCSLNFYYYRSFCGWTSSLPLSHCVSSQFQQIISFTSKNINYDFSLFYCVFHFVVSTTMTHLNLISLNLFQNNYIKWFCMNYAQKYAITSSIFDKYIQIIWMRIRYVCFMLFAPI